MRRTTKLDAKLIWAALALFVVMVVAAVLVNGLVFGYELVLNRSISRYVGYEVWSVVMFAVGNIFVGLLVARYLWSLGEVWKMPKLFYSCVVIMVVALWALSVCPVGFCDFDGHISLVSRIHEISSRLMFGVIMLMSMMVVLSGRVEAVTRVISIGYVVFAVVCIVGYMMRVSWFMSGMLIYELLYIVGFMVMVGICSVWKKLATRIS